MTKDQVKIALVTGSSRGLGKNTALALARKGVDVIVTYRSSEAEANSVVSAIAELGGKAVALNWILPTQKPLTGLWRKSSNHSRTNSRQSSLISWSTMPGLGCMPRLQKRLRKTSIA